MNTKFNEMVNLRDAFINDVIQIAQEEDRIVVLDADVGSATKTWNFREIYPERFYEFGIAEQNMFGVAAGLAATGRIPIAATFAVFASMRAAEMIRTSICYPKLNVKIIGGYAGLSNGKDGATHQSVEDIAIMRSFPNLVVMVPSDPMMARKIARTAVEYQGPVYIRMEYEEVPFVYDEDVEFQIGRGLTPKEGSDVTVVSYGVALIRVIETAKILSSEGIEVEVIDMPTIKPFDKNLLLQSVKKTGAIVTVEDHSVIGGLASMVSECLIEEGTNPRFRGLGIPDVFTESGTTSKLRDKYGIGQDAIISVVRDLVEKVGK
ncbi:Apulose-4-phosphate transketolase subunit B [subsurface metagenome]